MHSIIDKILIEAKVNKWSILQDIQIENMVNQFASQNRAKIQTNADQDFKKLKKPYFNYAKQFDTLIIKKLNLQISEEKSLLIWLLQQILNKSIKPTRIKEDSEIIKDNLKLFFENRKEINKKLYDITYLNVKEEVSKFKQDTEFSKHKEFLSKPLFENNPYKFYKITDADTCVKISQNTSWCVQNKSTASTYLKNGPLYLVTKNNHRFALLSFESSQFMDVNDVKLKTEAVEDLIKAWPEIETKILNTNSLNLLKYIKNLPEEKQEDLIKQNPNYIEYIRNPTQKIIDEALKTDLSNYAYEHILNKLSKEKVEEVVEKNKDLSLYIKNPSEKIFKNVLEILKKYHQKTFRLFFDVKNYTEQQQIEMVKTNPEIILNDINDWFEKPLEEALKLNGKLIKLFSKPSINLQMAAVKNTWLALGYIHNPDKSVIEEAKKINPRAEELV
jgi:hypothetical protein